MLVFFLKKVNKLISEVRELERNVAENIQIPSEIRQAKRNKKICQTLDLIKTIGSFLQELPIISNQDIFFKRLCGLRNQIDEIASVCDLPIEGYTNAKLAVKLLGFLMLSKKFSEDLNDLKSECDSLKNEASNEMSLLCEMCKGFGDEVEKFKKELDEI